MNGSHCSNSVLYKATDTNLNVTADLFIAIVGSLSSIVFKYFCLSAIVFAASIHSAPIYCETQILAQRYYCFHQEFLLYNLIYKRFLLPPHSFALLSLKADRDRIMYTGEHLKQKNNLFPFECKRFFRHKNAFRFPYRSVVLCRVNL